MPLTWDDCRLYVSCLNWADEADCLHQLSLLSWVIKDSSCHFLLQVLKAMGKTDLKGLQLGHSLTQCHLHNASKTRVLVVTSADSLQFDKMTAQTWRATDECLEVAVSAFEVSYGNADTSLSKYCAEYIINKFWSFTFLKGGLSPTRLKFSLEVSRLLWTKSDLGSILWSIKIWSCWCLHQSLTRQDAQTASTVTCQIAAALVCSSQRRHGTTNIVKAHVRGMLSVRKSPSLSIACLKQEASQSSKKVTERRIDKLQEGLQRAWQQTRRVALPTVTACCVVCIAPLQWQLVRILPSADQLIPDSLKSWMHAVAVNLLNKPADAILTSVRELWPISSG